MFIVMAGGTHKIKSMYLSINIQQLQLLCIYTVGDPSCPKPDILALYLGSVCYCMIRMFDTTNFMYSYTFEYIHTGSRARHVVTHKNLRQETWNLKE